MTTHTPGPWEAETKEFGDTPGWRPWVGRLGEHRYAALSCGETQEEAIANACLIAAAPELLVALRGLLNMWSTRTVEEARAAIAKATGGAS